MSRVIHIETSTLGKAFFVFVILLLVTFLLGLYIGQDSMVTKSAPANDEELRQQIHACSYKIQEITKKYKTLRDIAIKNNIINSKGEFITTPSPEKNTTETSSEAASAKIVKNENKIKKSADKTIAKKHSDSPAIVEKPQKKEHAPRKEPTVLKKSSKIDMQDKKQDKMEDVWDKIDKLDKNKAKASAPSPSSACTYSIQLFSGRSREEAVRAKKNYKLDNTRLVEGTVKGNTWFRVRYGCYAKRQEAVDDLDIIKNRVKGAIIVGNY